MILQPSQYFHFSIYNHSSLLLHIHSSHIHKLACFKQTGNGILVPKSQLKKVCQIIKEDNPKAKFKYPPNDYFQCFIPKFQQLHIFIQNTLVQSQFYTPFQLHSAISLLDHHLLKPTSQSDHQALQSASNANLRLIINQGIQQQPQLMALKCSFLGLVEWPMLIVCQDQLVFNWLQIIKQNFPKLSKKAQIIEHQKGSSKISIISIHNLLRKLDLLRGQGQVVIMQSKQLFSRQDPQSKICRQLLTKKKYVIILQNEWKSIKSQFNTLNTIRPDIFRKEYQFMDRYQNQIFKNQISLMKSAVLELKRSASKQMRIVTIQYRAKQELKSFYRKVLDELVDQPVCVIQDSDLPTTQKIRVIRLQDIQVQIEKKSKTIILTKQQLFQEVRRRMIFSKTTLVCLFPKVAFQSEVVPKQKKGEREIVDKLLDFMYKVWQS